MTREEKAEMLDECCHFYGKCDNCELRKNMTKKQMCSQMKLDASLMK